MAKINDTSVYPVTTPAAGDRLIGTDVSNTSNDASGETVNFQIDAIGDLILPAGVIVMWSGAVSAVPTGWHICDGTNGTPNLTGRFVVHADADTGGTYNVGATGGQTHITDVPEHTHGAGTLAADSDGAHSHNYELPNDATRGSGSLGARAVTGTTTATSTSGAHTHTISGSTASTGSASVDVRPPYYALAYIMKL